MTRLILTDKDAEFYPVVFKIYRLLDHDIKDRTTGEVIVRKGNPDNRTLHTITLFRRVKPNNVDKVETVGDTIKKLKVMLGNSNGTRYSLHSAPETDYERKRRYAENGLEVQAEEKKEVILLPPPKAIDDTELGIKEDDGRIHKKARKPKAKKHDDDNDESEAA